MVERLIVLNRTSIGKKILGVISLEDVVSKLEAMHAFEKISGERSQIIRDMIKRLTPYLLARYAGEERFELERDMNDEIKALVYLLEESEVSLRT